MYFYLNKKDFNFYFIKTNPMLAILSLISLLFTGYAQLLCESSSKKYNPGVALLVPEITINDMLDFVRTNCWVQSSYFYKIETWRLAYTLIFPSFRLFQ